MIALVIVLVLSLALNLALIRALRAFQGVHASAMKSAELLARSERSPSGKIWPPRRRDGAT